MRGHFLLDRGLPCESRLVIKPFSHWPALRIFYQKPLQTGIPVLQGCKAQALKTGSHTDCIQTEQAKTLSKWLLESSRSKEVKKNVKASYELGVKFNILKTYNEYDRCPNQGLYIHITFVLLQTVSE